ncbi:MAG: hypothetical protein HY748_13625 [Elusimicrobia bacterium]|nr:hypothetical protein [Elusimicrobiota bacterium]
MKISHIRRTLGLGLGLWAALACLLPSISLGLKFLVDSGGQSRWPNTRKVIYHPGYNRYWIFYANDDSPTLFVYRSFDGSNFTDEVKVIDDAGQTLSSMGSVWHIEKSSEVLVVMGDRSSDVAPNRVVGSNNKVFMRMGKLNANGTITWGVYSMRQPNPDNVFDNATDRADHYPPDAGGIVWTNNNKIAISVTGKNADAAPDLNTGVIGIVTISTAANQTINADGALYGYGDNNADADAVANLRQVLTGLIPIGPSNQTLVSYTDGSNGGTLVMDRFAAATRTNEFTVNAIDRTKQIDHPGYSVTISSVITEQIAHLAYIDSSGRLQYRRRTAAGTWTADIEVDGSGADTDPNRHPTIAYVQAANDENDGMVYIIYKSSYGPVHYAYASATNTVSADWTIVTEWQDDGNYPIAGLKVRIPQPIPVIFESGGLQFDQIGTSTQPAPTFASVSSAPAAGPYVTRTYDLIVDGANFQNGAVVVIQLSGENQAEIYVASTTFVSNTQLRASVAVQPPISGGPYDLIVLNPDAKFIRKQNAIRVDAPSVNMLADPDSGDGFVSGASFHDNAATGGVYRNMSVQGANFMAWSSTWTTRLEVRTGGGDLIGGVWTGEVTGLVTGPGAGSFTGGLKISTGAAPSEAATRYAVRVLNPDGQYATVSSTFVLTVATAGITFPIVGNGLDSQNRVITFSSVTGRMYFNPQDGQANAAPTADYSTQLRIKRVTDGYIWSAADGAFQNGTWFNDEDSFFATNSSDPWKYNWSPGDGEYELTARGITSDQPKTTGGQPTKAGGPFSNIVVMLKDSQSPKVDITRPPRASGANQANAFPLKVNLDDALGAGSTGSGVQKAWALIMTTAPLSNATTNQYITGKATETWVAWCRKGVMPGCECAAGDPAGGWCWDDNDSSRGQLHWISTGTSGNPPMEWTAKYLFRSLNIASATASGSCSQDVCGPPWVDGKEYYIALVSTDAMGLVGTSETSASTGSWSQAFPLPDSGYRFIYDVTVPTVTGHYSIVGLSTETAKPTVLNAVTVASGTVRDNVYAVASSLRILLRVQDTVTLKYLNPNTLIKFDVTSAGSGWAELYRTTDTWDFDLSLAQFVDGNNYKLELYGEDGAGNRAEDACPYDSDDEIGGPYYPAKCRTGSSTNPKYVRYFKRDQKAPKVDIRSPELTTLTNKLGGYLAQVTGTATDDGVGVSSVEYTLRFNQDYPTTCWELYTSTAGRWKEGCQADVWNIACDSVVGCGKLGGTWANWISSNIAFFDSQGYMLTVRAIDGAGNVSELTSMTFGKEYATFTLDRSSPTSVVTTAGGAYTSRVNAIAGTVADEVSTGTPAGLDGSNFYVAVKRLKKPWDATDFYWTGSTWTAATGAVYESSVNVLVGGGTGVKNWSLALPSTFYDLCRDTETFVVYTSARDSINFPGHEKNVESSATVKMVYSYRSSTSTVTNMVPAAGSASNVSGSVSFDIVPAEGGRTILAWFVAVDTDGYYWTASSWSANKYPGTGGLGLGDPLPLAVNISTPWVPGAVWLTTAAHTGKPPGSPDMAFEPGTTPDGLSTISLSLTDATTMKRPVWANGRKYKTYVRTRNTAFQHYDTGAQSFIYDVDSPTMTGHYFLRTLSSETALATPLSDISFASGTITDNVSDITDMRQIYMRVQDTVTGKYLNPNTLVNFDISVAANAWALIEQTND